MTIMEELDAYCSAVGKKPSTICVRALNDSRYPARHGRRIAALERDAKKLRMFMAENPPPAVEPEDAA